MDEFRRITTFTSAKKARDILQVTHEGTNVVEVSKLQMLKSRFETIRMDDHETFGEFHAKLMDIKNSSFNLCKPISNSKVVRKILRSLSEIFKARVTTIEESKDVDSLKIDELECTNFIAFAASVNEKPLKKEVLSESCESSDSNDDDMSFDTPDETLYKECLSLKQKQVKWKASKKILINEIDVLNGEKKALLDKIASLENEHLEVNKKCDVLKSENQMFKDELSLRKEESHPSFKRLNELINLGRKYFDKRGLGFVDGNATPSNDGNVARVKGKGTICVLDIPNLEEVFDLNYACVMIGLRTCDNCYVISQKGHSSSSLVCGSSKITCVNHLLQNEKEHPIVKVSIDRGRKFDDVNVVDRLKNHVLHSRSKHVDIKHPFIQDLVEDKVVSREFFLIKGQIANNITKPLDVSRYLLNSEVYLW
ncbi:hypothetical protein CK203_079708 [Vitis vinifera]|nr:hypothetical protein CK203_079708 [Vitis vinifera]